MLRHGHASMRARLRRDLTGCWLLNEASGTRADLSGKGNNLTDNNTVTGAVGPGGHLVLASQFTAANTETLTKASPVRLNGAPNGRLTVSFWVYFDADASSSIMGCYAGGTDESWQIWRQAANDSFLVGMSHDGTTTTTVESAANTAPVSTWKHVAVQYDGVAMSIRVNNGAPVRTVLSALNPGTAGFDIGASHGGDPTMDGRVAGVRVWSRALSVPELTYAANLAHVFP